MLGKTGGNLFTPIEVGTSPPFSSIQEQRDLYELQVARLGLLGRRHWELKQHPVGLRKACAGTHPPPFFEGFSKVLLREFEFILKND